MLSLCGTSEKYRSLPVGDQATDFSVGSELLKCSSENHPGKIQFVVQGKNGVQKLVVLEASELSLDEHEKTDEKEQKRRNKKRKKKK